MKKKKKRKKRGNWSVGEPFTTISISRHLLPLLPTLFLAISVSSSNFSTRVHPNTKPYLLHSFFLSLISLAAVQIYFRVLFLNLNVTTDFDPFRSLGVFGGWFCLRSWSFVLVVSASRECLGHRIDSLDHVCFFIIGLIFSSFHLLGFLLFAILGVLKSTLLMLRSRIHLWELTGMYCWIGFWRWIFWFMIYMFEKAIVRSLMTTRN